MLKLKMPECFVPESEVIGEPYVGKLDGSPYSPRRDTGWERLIRDQDGDVIFVFGTVADGLATRLTEFLGRVIEPVYFIRHGNYHKQAALALPEGETLDVEEMAAILAMVWTSHHYHHGIRRLKSELLADYISEYSGAPCVIRDKEIAFSLASAISEIHQLGTRPIRDGNRWGVVVKGGMSSRIAAEITGIHRLMERFDIMPKPKNEVARIANGRFRPDPNFAAEMAAKARSEDDRDEQRQRIENAVTAILARLGGPADAAPDSVLPPVGEASANMHQAEPTPEAKLAATIEANGGLMAAIDKPRKRPAAKSAKAKSKGKKTAAA